MPPRGQKRSYKIESMYYTLPTTKKKYCHQESSLQVTTCGKFTTCGKAIAEDSRLFGPVTVNWQFESGSPILPSYEQDPPPLLMSKKYPNLSFSHFLALPVFHGAFHLQISAECWQDAYPAIKFHKFCFCFSLLLSLRSI